MYAHINNQHEEKVKSETRLQQVFLVLFTHTVHILPCERHKKMLNLLNKNINRFPSLKFHKKICIFRCKWHDGYTKKLIGFDIS